MGHGARYSLEEFSRLSGHPLDARTLPPSSAESLAFLCEAAQGLEEAAPPRVAYMLQGQAPQPHAIWTRLEAGACIGDPM